MKFYDVSNIDTSIVHEMWDLVDADITAMPLVMATRRINAAYEELISMIINADGTWQFDDENFTTVPRGTATLVEGQELYSFATNYLQIKQIDVLSTDAGVWRTVKPLDRKEMGNQTTEEYFGVDSSGNPAKAFPTHYDIEGDSIRLFPAPTSTQVTLASGLRVSFTRTADLFTAADTTQEPGLPSTHHILLAYMGAIPYAMSYKKDRVGWLEKKVDDMKKTLLEHYAYREKNTRGVIQPRRRIFR